jgi:hypothetical protein
MEKPNYTQNNIGKNNRRRGPTGRYRASISPSTQETKNGPNHVDSDRGQLRAAKDPKRENINHSTNQ